MPETGIGAVRAYFEADTTKFDTSLVASKQQLKAMAVAADLAGDQVAAAGSKIDRAAQMQERAAERARRAWEREVLQQERAAQADAEAARAKELAALKADILTRSLEGQGRAQEFVNEATAHSVPQMAAASGAIRVLEGNMNNNVRAGERFLTSVLGLGPVLAAAFPLVGAVAMGALLGRLIGEVGQFASDASALGRELGVGWLDGAIAQMSSLGKLIKQVDDEALKLAQDRDQINEQGRQQDLEDARRYDRAHGTTTAYGIQGSQLQARIDALEKAKQLEVLAANQAGAKAANPLTYDESGSQGVLAARVEQEAHIDQYATLAAQQAELIRQKSGLIADAIQEGQEKQQEAMRKGTAAERTAASQMMEGFRRGLDEQKADHAMSLKDVEDYWNALVFATQKGQKGYNAVLAGDVVAERNKAVAQGVIELAKSANQDRFDFAHQAFEDQYKQIQSATSQSVDQTFNQMNEGAAKTAADQKRAALEMFKAAEAQIKADEQIKTTQLHILLGQGRISQLEYAMAMASMHEQDADRWTSAFGATQNNGAGMGLEIPERQRAERTVQGLEDQAAARSGLERLHDSALQLAQSFTDLPAHVTQFLDQTLNDLNGKLVDALSGKKGVNFSEVGVSMMKGVEKTGLEYVEGSAMKAFLGTNPNAKLGTRDNPMWTRAADGSSAGSGGGLLGNLLGKLGGLFGGSGGRDMGSAGASDVGSLVGGIGGSILTGLAGFAGGGEIPSNMPAIVGERGPEIFMPRSAGRIVPNDKAFGGGHTFNVAVDARGSGDPAATEAAVHRAMGGYMKQVPSMAVAAVHEYNSRRPKSMRI